MIKRFTRRLSLKLLAVAGLTGCKDTTNVAEPAKQPPAKPADTSWKNTNDRVFLGGEYWANPMEDWKIKNGWAECQTDATGRNIQSLTHQITDPKAALDMMVNIGQSGELKKNTGAGFLLGVSSDINEVRSNSFANNGIPAGISDKEIFVGTQRTALTGTPDFDNGVTLTLKGRNAALTVLAMNADGTELGSVTQQIPGDKLLGNVALVSQYGKKISRKDLANQPAFRFTDWKLQGDAFTIDKEQAFGPILWSMYTLSDSRSDDGFVMKMSALTGPLGDSDNHNIELQIEVGEQWKSLGKASLDTDAWTATFKIPNWDEKRNTPYRLIYSEKFKDGTATNHDWTGTIKANPNGRPLRLAGLTCQKDYGFPYAPVANNLVKLDPDMLYFSGDQLYEAHGGYGVIRDPADISILNYLRKFYMFGWAFRDAMRNAPTVCIPDDHDVFHGNIWGEGGAAMAKLDQGTSSNSGYRQPARMVNAVHRTNAGHHPDPYDPNPVKQDISVYYGDLVYGDVSFAIIADRQWKSGPHHVDTAEGRADHVSNPDFDTTKLDKAGLILLGERQEEFLEKWAKDWRGHQMKILLSQTVFSGVATHHGAQQQYLKADLDSGAWPQTARNRTIEILRESMALHINGDQHLTTMSQYGVDQQRDSNWSFCTPAIAAGYPRWWLPDELDNMPHENRPKHGFANTGEFHDGLGNKVYVYAVGNPVKKPSSKNRYEVAHQKGSGFGLITVDTSAKTYLCESFRFQIDATDGKTENQFPGWPIVIHQAENKGENKVG